MSYFFLIAARSKICDASSPDGIKLYAGSVEVKVTATSIAAKEEEVKSGPFFPKKR